MLFRPKSTFIFCNSLFENQFEILPKKHSEFICVSTPVGESILVERVYCDCPIFVSYKSAMTDLIGLDVVDFDVILGMNYLHAYYSSIDFRTRVMKFQIPNELVI